MKNFVIKNLIISWFEKRTETKNCVDKRKSHDLKECGPEQCYYGFAIS